MVSQTNEKALETLIVNTLKNQGYCHGDPKHFDRTLAIDTDKFWAFLHNTQPQELEKLHTRTNWQKILLERCDRLLKKNGILTLLKQGIKIDAAHLTLFYSQPYNTLNPQLQKNFEQNIFSVTQQVHHNPQNQQKSIDLVLFINGLAIATLELKNPWTGQDEKYYRCGLPLPRPEKRPRNR